MICSEHVWNGGASNELVRELYEREVEEESDQEEEWQECEWIEGVFVRMLEEVRDSAVD